LMRFLRMVGLLAAPLLAQSTSSLSGTVTDLAGQLIDAANVRARNTQTGTTAAATSDRNGKYLLDKLPPGTYDVTIAGVPAMANFEQKNVSVGASAAVLNIRMNYNTQFGTLGEDRINASADMRRHKPPSGPTPRANGKPDFSGVWWRPTDVEGGNPQ